MFIKKTFTNLFAIILCVGLLIKIVIIIFFVHFFQVRHLFQTCPPRIIARSYLNDNHRDNSIHIVTLHVSYMYLRYIVKCVHSAGTGKSKGCIPFLNVEAKVSNILQVANRECHFKLKVIANLKLFVIGTHAPNGYDAEKTTLFQESLEVIDSN